MVPRRLSVVTRLHGFWALEGTVTTIGNLPGRPATTGPPDLDDVFALQHGGKGSATRVAATKLGWLGIEVASRATSRDGGARVGTTRNELPGLLSVQQASEVLGLSLRTTYRAIRRGDIPAVHWGTRIKVRRGDLLSLIGEEGAAAPPESTRVSP